MSEHKIILNWKKQTESFEYQDYNRDHQWDFGEGLLVNASLACNLRPQIKFVEGGRNERLAIEKIHHQSHQRCFLANSVRSEVIIEPIWN